MWGFSLGAEILIFSGIKEYKLSIKKDGWTNIGELATFLIDSLYEIITVTGVNPDLNSFVLRKNDICS